jgi:serine/threonine-protein kinase
MGEVYRARDSRLGRDVALKVLPEAFAGDADRLMRFEREARTLASLNHPSIAQVYGIEDSTAIRALVMELVDGDDLSVRIARGAIPIDEALSLAWQVADALDAAHTAGIIHRDLKPGNIKVREDGTVKVLDFGLARALDQDPGTSRHQDLASSPTITSPAITRAGIILGTAAYMSPEQAKGRPVDKRADIWAFGTVLFEMLTGARAFDGEDITDTLALVLRGEPDWSKLPVGLPPPVAVLLKRCLERDLRRRLGDMSAVRFVFDELQSLAGPTAARSADLTGTVARTPAAVTGTRWHTLLGAALPLAVVAIAAGGLATYAAKRTVPAPPAPMVTRFELQLPEGQILALSRRLMALSPDGRDIAFVTDNQLFVRRLAEFETVPLPGVEAGQAPTSPVYSPDGAWIAFHSGTERAIKRVSSRGGAPVGVCEIPTAVTVSWDPSGILVGGGTAGVLRCEPEGGTPQTILKATDTEIMLGPQMLPGGRSMLVTIGSTADIPAVRWDRAHVIAYELATGQRRTLVGGGSDGQYVSTGHLLYRAGGILFAAPFDPERAELRGEPVPVVEGVMRGTLGGSHVATSPTGTLAYIPGPIASNPNARELAVADRAGAVTQLPLAAGPYVHVRVSPNARVAALGSDNGKDAIVWIYAMDGQSSVRRLTLEGQNRFPIWAPDSEWITYQSDRNGDAALYRQRADGTGNAERLTTAARDESHIPESWTPDGRGLAYAVRKSDAQGPHYTLMMLDVASRASRPFAHVTSREPTGAVFSPNGRWFAYTSTPSDDVSGANRGVFVQPVPATGAVFQVPRQLVDFHPMWSADGRELLLLASTNARQMAAVRVTVDGGVKFGTPTRFPATVTGDRLSAEPRSFDLLPDGRIIGVVNRSEIVRPARTDLRIVLNWFEELKQRVPVR